MQDRNNYYTAKFYVLYLGGLTVHIGRLLLWCGCGHLIIDDTCSMRKCKHVWNGEPQLGEWSLGMRLAEFTGEYYLELVAPA